MRKIRIISAILAILLAFSAMSLPVFAAVDIIDYPTFDDYTAQQLKVDSMTLKYEDANWQLYFDEQSAEFALKNKKTGEYTFSNPHDIAINQPLASTAATADGNQDSIRQALLSQIILTYEDVSTGVINTMWSFKEAALPGGQIQFKDIDNGVRVEYALGTVDTKRLIPQWIEKNSFETQIINVLQSRFNEMNADEKHIFDGMQRNYYKLLSAINETEDVVYDPQATPDPANPQTFEFMVNNRGSPMYVYQGSGERTKKNIESLGYNYEKVQKRVNELLKNKKAVPTGKTSRDVAVEVIRGKWGNGAARTKALKDAGYNPTEVQMYVNMLLK